MKKKTFSTPEGVQAIPENCVRCEFGTDEDIKSDALVRCTLKNPEQNRSGNHWYCKSFHHWAGAKRI